MNYFNKTTIKVIQKVHKMLNNNKVPYKGHIFPLLVLPESNTLCVTIYCTPNTVSSLSVLAMIVKCIKNNQKNIKTPAKDCDFKGKGT